MIGPGWLPKPRAWRKRTLAYTRRRRRRIKTHASAPQRVHHQAVIFDREPAELPVATLRPREASQRARVLVDHLRHWLAARWMWLRPRTVPVVAAAVGTLLVRARLDALHELDAGARPGVGRIVEGAAAGQARRRVAARRDPGPVTVRAVHHLNCATMCPIAGWLMGSSTWRAKMVAHCLLLETERDGLVLVDTGFGTRDVEGATRLSPVFKRLVGPTLEHAETAIAQVAALGYKPEDVRHLVVTHLDVDHAGGLVDFPNARVHVHAREHAAALARATFKERERYLRAHWAHGPKWEVYTEDGDTWRGLPAITRLRGLDADVGIVPMHGHTRGHSAVIARHDERWLVHAGDAYFIRRTVDGSGPQGAGRPGRIRADRPDQRAGTPRIARGAAPATHALRRPRSVLRARRNGICCPASTRMTEPTVTYWPDIGGRLVIRSRVIAERIAIVASQAQDRLAITLDEIGPPGMASWDPVAGTIVLRGRTFQAEQLGSFDGSSWLWSWANPYLNIPEQHTSIARAMRAAAGRLGLPAFGAAMIEDDDEALPDMIGGLAIAHGFTEAYFVANRSQVYALVAGQLTTKPLDDRLASCFSRAARTLASIVDHLKGDPVLAKGTIEQPSDELATIIGVGFEVRIRRADPHSEVARLAHGQELAREAQSVFVVESILHAEYVDTAFAVFNGVWAPATAGRRMISWPALLACERLNLLDEVLVFDHVARDFYPRT